MKRKIKSYMPCRYSLEKDLGDRLSGCTFMFDGIPRYVEWTGYGTKLRVYEIDMSSMIEEIDADDPRLDISSIELGYMNADDKVYYLARNPMKRYYQGVCPSNVMIFSICGNPTGQDAIMFKGGKFHYPVRTKEFQKSVLGDFPSISEVFEGKKEEIAISQELALYKDELDLYIMCVRGEAVGFFEDDGILKIPSRRTSWIVQNIFDRNEIECRIRTAPNITGIKFKEV